jgi:ribosomal RNA-processing protein 7
MTTQKSSTAVASVNEFTVLPIPLPSAPSYPKETTHYLYLRANAPKVPTPDTPREVFLVNIPIDTTEAHIRTLFVNHLGGSRIENVAFEGARVGKGITAPVAPTKKKSRKRKRGEGEADGQVGVLPDTWDRELHRSGATAIVTFMDQASAQLAIKEAKKAVKSGKQISWDALVKDQTPPLGSARYLAHQRLRYPDPELLQMSVDNYMAAFAAAEAERARQRLQARSVPDADGFITVTRGGRTGPAREDEARAKDEELKKREKERVKEDFYRFQVREKRKAEAMDLAKGFEEDMKKVEEMRKRRGKVRPE